MGKRIWKDKIYNSIMFLAAICTIISITELGIVKKIFKINDNKSINESLVVESLSCIDYENSVTNNNNQNSIDVNEEVEKIKLNYELFQEKNITPKESQSNLNVLVYSDNGKIVAIKVLDSYDNIDYSRVYYFDKNEKLYFAFLYNNDIKYRLYFKDDILIRYIDDQGFCYDLNDDFIDCKWENFVLNESYNLLSIDDI